jgi:hypothetical protein
MSYAQSVAKEREQRTPKGAKIPIPKRKDFDAVLNAAAKPIKKSSTPKRSPKK